MKVISSYHDYYDSALIHHDNDVIYQRTPIEIKIETGVSPLYLDIFNKFDKYLFKNYWFNATNFQEWRFDDVDLASYNKRLQFKHIRDFTISQFKFLIIFCGKIYPGIEYRQIFTDTKMPTIKTFVYDEPTALAYLNNRKIKLKGKSDNSYLKNFFSNSGKSVETEFLINNKITNIILLEDKKLLINSRLATFEFYKVFDVYTCYQELEMWMSGTLSYPQNMMIEVEDKIKVTKHGFDKQYGFRTRPKNV